MSFGVLTVIVLAGLGGPLLSNGKRLLAPLVVGELLAGLAIGRTGLGRLHPEQPTLSFLADIGFAMLMFTAGMHVPLRSPALVRQLRRGTTAALVAGALSAGAGWAAASVAGVSHAGVYAVVLGGGSAAVLVPALQELGLMTDADALVVAAQVAVADIAGIVVVPLVLRPNHALHALLGAVAVAACATSLLLVPRLVRGAAWVGRLRRQSKHRGWALDLRISLLVLFGLCWLATRAGTSILMAGFAVGLLVAAIGGPKRLSRQVTGVAQGFFVPLYFVVLGARIDVRELTRHAALIELALLLAAFDVAVHLAAALLTRQSAAAGLAATAQLGVPAAVVSLGLQEGIVSPGDGASIMTAALASIVISQTGVALLARRAAASAGPQLPPPPTGAT